MRAFFFQDLRIRGLGDPAARGQRRGMSGAGDHPGDRGKLSAIGAPALLPHTGCAISRPRSRRIHGRNSRPGVTACYQARLAGDCAPTGDRHPRRLRQRPAERARLLRR